MTDTKKNKHHCKVNTFIAPLEIYKIYDVIQKGKNLK